MTHPTSPPHPAGPHPSIDDLADLAEGLTESHTAARALRDHLAGCPECRDTLDALTEVQDLLGSVETPAMPADVARRLNAALAAEAAAPRTPAATAHPDPQQAAPHLVASHRTATTAPPRGPGRPRARLRRRAVLLGGAFALAAVAVGAVLLSPTGPGQRGDSAAGSVAAATDPAADRPGTAGTEGTGGPPDTAAAPGARLPALAAATAYRADTLPMQIRQLLNAGKDAAQPGNGREPTAPDSGEESAAPTATISCVPTAPAALLATDQGTFEGRPVDVLVYATPGNPDLVDVYLVDPGCAAGPDAVRLHRTVPLR